MSAGPPAPKGTMIRAGLLGYCCAGTSFPYSEQHSAANIAAARFSNLIAPLLAGMADSIGRVARGVNRRRRRRLRRVRPPEQPLKLLLEQQIGERDLVFEGFARDCGVARRFELQMRIDFTLLGHEPQAGFAREMNH